jgi:hypothetical protein
VKHASGAFSWTIGIIGVLVLLNTAGPALAWLSGGAAA